MFTSPSWSMVFHVQPKNGNAGDCIVAHDIFTNVCGASFLSWTRYFISVQFILMDRFLYLPLSIATLLCVRSDFFLKWSYKTDFCVHSWGMNFHLCVICCFASQFQCCHKHWKKPFFSSIQPSTTSFPCFGAPTAVCANIDSKYSSVAHWYCSAQISLFL